MADKLNPSHTKPIRVMIVEDSSTTLELLVNVLEAEDDLEIAGTAKNGLEAVENVAEIAPDIILMDINMPIMNGFEASGKIMQEYPVPILLVSASWKINDVKPIVESMQLGVLGVYKKPPSPFDSEFDKLMSEMVEAIRVMSQVKVIKHKYTQQKIINTQKIPLMKDYKHIVIGASTGGPPILYKILSALPENYPYPLIIAQHMSGEFIENFIEWLNTTGKIKVKAAKHLEPLVGGCAYIAPKGYHILLQDNRIILQEASHDEMIVPKISNLFASIKSSEAKQTIAILLSGMGEDGADSITSLHTQGAMTIAQNEASSVVYGMAKKAVEFGGIELILSPEEIIELLLQAAKREEVA